MKLWACIKLSPLGQKHNIIPLSSASDQTEEENTLDTNLKNIFEIKIQNIDSPLTTHHSIMEWQNHLIGDSLSTFVP